MEPSEFVKVSEVASVLNVTTKTVRDWIAQGRVDHILLPGGHYRVRKPWLDKWKKDSGATAQKAGGKCTSKKRSSGTRKGKPKSSRGSGKR